MLTARTGYAIIAELHVAPAAFDAFVAGMQLNASSSLEREAGCLHFEVQPDRAESKVTLFEAYSDRAAFDAHLATEHFLAWKGTFFPMITERSSVHLKPVEA